MIRIKAVDAQNLLKVCRLTASRDCVGRKGHCRCNAVSIAEAKYHAELHPNAIYHNNALIGFFIGEAAPAALGIVLRLAGGAMLYVVFFGLLPEAYRQWQSKWAILFTVVGFALGVLLTVTGGHTHVH